MWNVKLLIWALWVESRLWKSICAIVVIWDPCQLQLTLREHSYHGQLFLRMCNRTWRPPNCDWSVVHWTHDSEDLWVRGFGSCGSSCLGINLSPVHILWQRCHCHGLEDNEGPCESFLRPLHALFPRCFQPSYPLCKNLLRRPKSRLTMMEMALARIMIYLYHVGVSVNVFVTRVWRIQNSYM